MKRVCIFCKHFSASTGDLGYSEYTPGYSWSMDCRKSKWSFDPYMDGTKEYREKLMMAETCPDFELADDMKEGAKK